MSPLLGNYSYELKYEYLTLVIRPIELINLMKVFFFNTFAVRTTYSSSVF